MSTAYPQLYHRLLLQPASQHCSTSERYYAICTFWSEHMHCPRTPIFTNIYAPHQDHLEARAPGEALPSSCPHHRDSLDEALGMHRARAAALKAPSVPRILIRKP